MTSLRQYFMISKHLNTIIIPIAILDVDYIWPDIDMIRINKTFTLVKIYDS